MQTNSATADIRRNLGSDSELSDLITCQSPTSEVESEAELGIEKEDYLEPESSYMEKALANESGLIENYQNIEIDEAEQRNQTLQNRLDGTEALKT